VYLDPAFVQTKFLQDHGGGFELSRDGYAMTMQEARCNGKPGLRDSPAEALYATQKSPACIDFTYR